MWLIVIYHSTALKTNNNINNNKKKNINNIRLQRGRSKIKE